VNHAGAFKRRPCRDKSAVPVQMALTPSSFSLTHQPETSAGISEASKTADTGKGSPKLRRQSRRQSPENHRQRDGGEDHPGNAKTPLPD
jgi:hypothetical protein